MAAISACAVGSPIGDCAITIGANYFAVQDYERADGNLAVKGGGTRLFDGHVHVFLIVHARAAGREGITYSTIITSCSSLLRRA